MMAKTKKNTRAGATIQPLGPVRPLLAAPSPRVVLTLSLADRLVHVVGELLRGDLLVEELIEVAQQRGRLCRRERLIPRHLEIRRRLGQLVDGHSEVGSSRRNLGVEILDRKNLPTLQNPIRVPGVETALRQVRDRRSLLLLGRSG